MQTNNEMVIKDLGKEGVEPFEEIILDISEKSKYKIIVPLLSDSLFIPVDESGREIPVSSIMICDTRTIIDVPGNAPQLKLKVAKPSALDSSGTTSTYSEDEDGDRFSQCAVKVVDWLMREEPGNVDDETKRNAGVVQNAKREIIVRKART